MLTKYYEEPTQDPMEALLVEIYRDHSCGEYQSEARDVQDGLNNLRGIVQAMFAHLDRSAQIEILKTLGWEQK